MTYIAPNASLQSALYRSYSSNGSTWSSPTIVIGARDFPTYTIEAGVAGDEVGNTVSSSTLVGFGAPPNLGGFYSPDQMDMYGVFVDRP
jgi:hypothetical protein